MNYNKFIIKSAILLLVLVFFTGHFASSTICKYIVTNSSKNSARVAKFGITITASGEENNVFLKEYLKEGTGGEYSIHIKSTSDDKIIAPGMIFGTSNIQIKGKAEVAVNVKVNCNIKIEGLDDIILNYDGKKGIKLTDVIPIKFYTIYNGEKEQKDINELSAFLNEKLAKSHVPNEEINENISISMEWPIDRKTEPSLNRDDENSGEAGGTTEEVPATSEDTNYVTVNDENELDNLILSNLTKIEFDLSISVEQID